MKRTVIAVILIFLPNLVLADFSCSTEVGYNWKKKDGQGDAIKVVVNDIGANGATEAEARDKINKIAKKQRRRAKKLCSDKHENMTGCISNRFIQSSTILATLNFSARKSLEDAIMRDCENMQGECLDSFVSEIVCNEVVLQVAPQQKTASDTTKKKDEKVAKSGKKGKKKK